MEPLEKITICGNLHNCVQVSFFFTLTYTPWGYIMLLEQSLDLLIHPKEVTARALQALP